MILRPEILSKLSSLELRAKKIIEGFISGLHRSPYHGFSVEFAEHRPYNPGDDFKHIDWKAYGKKERFYVKQYEEETNLRCYVLLDTSSSMLFKHFGEWSKLRYGIHYAASLMYLMEIPQICGKMGELNQVWTNILVNACDVLPDGGTIKIRTKTEGEYKLVVEISDNGPGIPEEVIPRIFEPNFTTKNQGAKFGLGLGLAISNEIIRQHGGFIKASNRESGGAKFQIILPVRDC
jgi:signal transduction histidine kinase